MENIGDKIKLAIKESGLTQLEISRRMGKSVALVNRWTKGDRDMSTPDIKKFCEICNITPGFLLSSEKDTSAIPVIGYVQAGLWQEALQWDQSDFKPIYIPTDDIFKGKRIYALEIRGDSMNLLYPTGSCVVCVSAEDYFDCVGEIESGKKVVVRRVNPMDGSVEATVKQFIKDDTGTYLKPQSTNAIYKPIRIDDGSCGETKITGVVIGSFRTE